MEEMKNELIEAGGVDLPTTSSDLLTDALEKASTPTLVAGSLFLVGETLGILQEKNFEVSLQ
jgi:folylpolyglutamate synthase/dihydropteroate synthase